MRAEHQDAERKLDPCPHALSESVALCLLGGGVWLSIYAATTLLLSPTGGRALLKGWYWPTLIVLVLGALLGVFGIHRRRRLEKIGGVAPSGFVIRLAFYVMVITVVAYSWVFSQYDFLVVVVTCGLAGSAFAGLGGLWVRGPCGALGRGLDMLAFNLCLLLVAGEVLLSMYGQIRPSVLVTRADVDAAAKVEQSRLPPHAPFFGGRLNAGGYNDGPFVTADQRSTPMVLNIGDSFSVGQVPHYYHYTTVAERLLGDVDIYNMGVSAIGPREYRHLLLTEGLDLKPDAVVVALFVGNDFGHKQPKYNDLRLGPRFFDRRNLLMYLVPSRLGILYSNARSKASQGEGAAADSVEGELAGLEAIHGAFPWLENPLLEVPVLSEKQVFRVEREAAERLSVLPEAQYRARLDDNLLVMREATSAPIWVMVIPSRFQLEDDLWRRIERRSGVKNLKRDRAQRIIMEWMREHGFPAVNLLAAFRAVPRLEDGSRHLYAKGDTHTNRRGNDVQGRELARLIRTQRSSKL